MVFPMSATDTLDLPAQLQSLERELRRSRTAMLELDAVAAGRLAYAGRLVRRASIILGDQDTIR